MLPLVLTVSQLNRYVKSVLDGNEKLVNVFLGGEISNFTNHYRTGHFYFTLKDEAAAVHAVMFRDNARRLRFVPEDGLKVIVRGRVSLYEPAGQYQLYADDMQPDGLGALNLAFEQLRDKLAREGLFDPSRKKPLPRFPRKVGVITSPTGAAVQDIFSILKRRFPIAEIVFCPVPVQGEGAHLKLTEAVERMNVQKAADVLIIGRGGGSAEDLWEFNSEALARAIRRSEIPVISAVGHETDYTICDFAADVRAPTPSAAAELAVPEAKELLVELSTLRRRLTAAAAALLQTASAALCSLREKDCFADPLNLVNIKRMALDSACRRLAESQAGRLVRERTCLERLTASLAALDPLSVLRRGFAAASDKNGNRLRSALSVRVGEDIRLRFADGTFLCKVKEKL